MDLRLNDKLAIAEVVNNWAIWRDAGDWDRFRTVWHADGWMTATLVDRDGVFVLFGSCTPL